jgi:hypothetical protein
MIPFESFNLLYRGKLKERLESLRAETDLSFGRAPTYAAAKSIPISAHRIVEKTAVELPHVLE